MERKKQRMKQFYLLLLLTLSITTVKGQSIIGKWETYDEKSNEKKAVIEIYKEQNLYFAKIVETFTDKENEICEKCEGDKKNKPIIGLIIIENIKKNDDEFDGGTVLDPESGETYSCNLKLIGDNKLRVRGFIGFSVFGRTQYWLRKK